MKKLLAALPMMVLAGAASASNVAVPEISALEGTAAIAALVAVVAIAWERRRRAA